MVTVKFFAMLKLILGTDELKLEVGSSKTVRDIIKSLEQTYPEIEKQLDDSKSMIAVNHQFADPDSPIKDGDELAFIPPMSGGSGLVRIQREDFSIDDELERIKKSSTDIGGVAFFLGTVRAKSRGRQVAKIEFEHYPEMAEKQLELIREQSLEKFDILETLIIHRYGSIDLGENIVLIVVGAEHRQDAFDACRWCIDELKQITPIWKKEITPEGDFWVEQHP